VLRKGKHVQRQTVTDARKAAESLAIEALAFIASDPERLSRFLALTGIEPQEIRAAAQDPTFLAAVVDYVAADERLLLDFVRDNGGDPREVARACTTLRGPDWERETA
jgi:hypothetical protein